jgi:hypothetical protein
VVEVKFSASVGAAVDAARSNIMNQLENKTCSACGGTDHLRTSFWHEPQMICLPCFLVWYDPNKDIDTSDPKAVGRESLRLKALGEYPWTGKYAPSTDPF